MKLLWPILLFYLLSSPVSAGEPAALSSEHTAFFGMASKQQYLPDVAQSCPENHVCMDGYYVWTLQVQEHISGPDVPRKVRAAMLQHSEYIYAGKQRSMYVIAKILDPDKRKLFGTDYYIEEYVPPKTVYCLGDKTANYGLERSEKVHPTSMSGCYSP